MTVPVFGHRYTVIPDSGVVELHCGTHNPPAVWEVGYHPSLDVLIERAQAHDVAEHDNDSAAEPAAWPAATLIHFTDDGCMWLQCFADDPAADSGQIIVNVEPGEEWGALAAKVREHQAAHGCAATEPGGNRP
jgi:hypothetical protein